MNKLLKSKKAMLLYYIVIPGFIVGLITFYIAHATYAPLKTDYLGEKQVALIKTSQEANKYLIFIDQSVKLSADESIQNLAEKGGFTLRSPCGTVDEYNLWNYKNVECYPDYKKELSAELNIILNNYLQKLPSEEFVEANQRLSFYPKIPSVNYNFFLTDSQIIGIASKRIQINLYLGELKVGQYNVYPSFNVNKGLNIEEFTTIETEAKELIQECNGNTELQPCITQNKPENWRITCKDEKSFCFEVEKQTIYNFALNFWKK